MPYILDFSKIGFTLLLSYFGVNCFQVIETTPLQCLVEAKTSIPSREHYINGGLVHVEHIFMRQITNYFHGKFFGQRKLLST